MFGFSPFADAPFASLANKSVSGNLAVTLDDVTFAASGNITKHGTLAVTLDDVSVVMAGNDIHAGTLAVTLDDVSVSASGKVGHNGALNIQLDDVSFVAAGSDTHNGTLALTLDNVIVSFIGAGSETGTLSVQLDDISFAATGTVVHPDVQLVTKGGLPKKKIKRDREEVEKAVENAVNKALGIVEPETIVEQPIVEKAPQIDYTAHINELMLKAQAEALGLSIEQYLIESELDDEETILLFL
jgi:hypothetical protein